MTNGHLCSISGYLDYQEHFFSHLKIGAGVGDVDPLMHDADDDGDDDDDDYGGGDDNDNDDDDEDQSIYISEMC